MSDDKKGDETADLQRQVAEWQALATVWRQRAQTLEDQLAAIEADRLIQDGG